MEHISAIFDSFIEALKIDMYEPSASPSVMISSQPCIW